MGPRNVGLGLFAQLQKNLREMPKKGLKTGQNGVNFLFGPHTCRIISSPIQRHWVIAGPGPLSITSVRGT